MKIVTRDVPPRAAWALEQAGVHPLLARLYAARGICAREELDDGLGRLLPPEGLKGTSEAAVLLADAIAAGLKLCIVADYDCDGATACAVGLRGLRQLGAKHVEYLVPDRVMDGYGLTPAIAHRSQVPRVTPSNAITRGWRQRRRSASRTSPRCSSPTTR